MASRRFYDLLYRVGAPWEMGPREELTELISSGRVSPAALPPGRAIDLGCGTGANAVFLAEHGFEVTGVDLSPVAIRKARDRAVRHGVAEHARFLVGDLTATAMPELAGPFDLLVDYGTLDDLRGAEQRLMAATVRRLARPGAVFVWCCFYATKDELPWISLSRPSRLVSVIVPGAGAIAPGAEAELFGDWFSIERLARPAPGSLAACFLLTRLQRD